MIVDCTPKRIAAKNVDTYRRRGLKFILQGGEKHAATGHSFVAECNYASALGRDATRVVSCNTTSVVRTLTALKRAGLLKRGGNTATASHRPVGKPLPETIDAIRALSRTIADANESIAKTNAALGIGPALI